MYLQKRHLTERQHEDGNLRQARNSPDGQRPAFGGEQSVDERP